MNIAFITSIFLHMNMLSRQTQEKHFFEYKKLHNSTVLTLYRGLYIIIIINQVETEFIFI